MSSNYGARQRKALADWALEEMRFWPWPVLGQSRMPYVQRHCILWALVLKRGSIRQAARQIGLSVRTIQQRVKDWGFVYVSAQRKNKDLPLQGSGR